MTARRVYPERYVIDLELPEEERWAEVIRARRRHARRLFKNFEAQVKVPTTLLAPFGAMYRASGGRCAGEIDAWADALGVSAGVLTAAQCSYELSMAGAYAGTVFGCTAAVVGHAAGPVHLRVLDWDLPGMREATAIFDFVGGDHDFVVVGLTGFVGALTGMVRGSYSVSINQAPPSQRPSFDFAPSFLLRDVLESCATYEDAVYALKHTAVAAPAFFTVCGTDDDEACVVERRRREHKVRRMSRGLLVQANHHLARAWKELTYSDPEFQDDSETRQELAQERLRDRVGTPAQLLRALEVFPIDSNITVQRIAMHPRSGSLLVRV